MASLGVTYPTTWGSPDPAYPNSTTGIVPPGIASGLGNGETDATVLRAGIHLVRFFDTFDGAAVDLQYSEDGGSTWITVSVPGLFGVTAPMTKPVEIRCAEFHWRFKISGGGGSVAISISMVYSGQ